jgi:hypothetical protein
VVEATGRPRRKRLSWESRCEIVARKVLRRHGYSRLPRAEGAGARCARRYERERPGELLHIDTKRLGRTSVWGHDS